MHHPLYETEAKYKPNNVIFCDPKTIKRSWENVKESLTGSFESKENLSEIVRFTVDFPSFIY